MKNFLRLSLSKKMDLKMIESPYTKMIYILPSLFLSVNYLVGHCSIVYLIKALKLGLSSLDYSLDLGSLPIRQVYILPRNESYEAFLCQN